MTIEDELDKIIRDDSPTSTAVKSLVNAGTDSEDNVELKTDLTEEQIKIHSVLKLLHQCLSMEVDEFESKSILGKLINIVERKSWSKDRKSRQEIVAVAKQPDQMNVGGGGEGFFQKAFTPRK